MRSLRYAFALLTIAALTACGGGGGGASPFAAASASGVAVAPAASGVAAVSGVVAASGVGAVMASKIQLLVSSPQLPSAGTTPVTLTAVVLSAANQTMAGRTVTFSIPPTETAFTSYITPNGVSDANGLVTATLNLGANKANRIITVSAIVDGVSTIGTIDVVVQPLVLLAMDR